MKLSLPVAASLLLFVAATATHVSAEEEDGVSRFYGTWHLSEWTVTDDDGNIQHPFGPNAVGRITYGSDGSMSVHLMDPSVPHFKEPDPALATAEEIAGAWMKYFAYFGTYLVDNETAVVAHRLVGCTFPNWNKTTQQRRFQFKAGSLILEAETAGKKTHRLVWRRSE